MVKKELLCPRCKKKTMYAEENLYRPFCSSLCKMQDIGAWAYEEYRVPGDPVSPEELFEHHSKSEEDFIH